MNNVINFRLARKARMRADKERLAQENRARFGRTKSAKDAAGQEKAKSDQILDGAKLED